jgi:NAD(P)-dependent dehydrogenase (short-subunit alcohol dehydrogenase family)
VTRIVVFAMAFAISLLNLYELLSCPSQAELRPEIAPARFNQGHNEFYVVAICRGHRKRPLASLTGILRMMGVCSRGLTVMASASMPGARHYFYAYDRRHARQDFGRYARPHAVGPAGRRPRMSAGAYSFLASEEASFITNAVLSIDGSLITDV